MSDEQMRGDPRMVGKRVLPNPVPWHDPTSPVHPLKQEFSPGVKSRMDALLARERLRQAGQGGTHVMQPGNIAKSQERAQAAQDGLHDMRRQTMGLGQRWGQAPPSAQTNQWGMPLPGSTGVGDFVAAGKAYGAGAGGSQGSLQAALTGQRETAGMMAGAGVHAANQFADMGDPHHAAFVATRGGTPAPGVAATAQAPKVAPIRPPVSGGSAGMMGPAELAGAGQIVGAIHQPPPVQGAQIFGHPAGPEIDAQIGEIERGFNAKKQAGFDNYPRILHAGRLLPDAPPAAAQQAAPAVAPVTKPPAVQAMAAPGAVPHDPTRGVLENLEMQWMGAETEQTRARTAAMLQQNENPGLSALLSSQNVTPAQAARIQRFMTGKASDADRLLIDKPHLEGLIGDPEKAFAASQAAGDDLTGEGGDLLRRVLTAGSAGNRDADPGMLFGPGMATRMAQSWFGPTGAQKFLAGSSGQQAAPQVAAPSTPRVASSNKQAIRGGPASSLNPITDFLSRLMNGVGR